MVAPTSPSAEIWNIRRLFTYAAVGIAVLAAKRWARTNPESITDANECDKPQYTVRTLSYDPLIQHIENFITPNEIQQLLKLGQDKFRPSTSLYPNGSDLENVHRTSWTAHIESNSTAAKCILRRVAEYQGFTPLHDVEDLQLTRYYPGQFFHNHYDWLQQGDLSEGIVDRDTTFFAALQSDCTKCGTNFPLLVFDWSQEDKRWCKFVDCDAPTEDGLIVKPVVGSALFWKNLHEDGTGDRRMLHAGLPVAEGTKIGLNIWTAREFGPPTSGLDILEPDE